MLARIAVGELSPWHILGEAGQAAGRPRMLQYWERLHVLCQLAHGRAPAVVGLAHGPCTADMHHDEAHRVRFFASKMALSELGRALVEGKEDFSHHDPVHRWWGGTLLTSANLWRWDAANQVLLAPWAR